MTVTDVATHLAQQRTLSVLQRKHGLDPSHFVFLIRHLSHAFRTRLRYFDLVISEDGDSEERSLPLVFGRTGDIAVNGW